MSWLEKSYSEVVQSISGKKPVLVAVSKFQPVQAVEELYRLGHRDFGENYVQELLEKARQLEARGCKDIRWHFIGHLQTNKVKKVAALMACLHSLDSERLASKLSEECTEERKTPLPVFVEVNVDEEPNKTGVMPSEILEFVKKVSSLPGLSIEGLMCIPAVGRDRHSGFAFLKELERKCRPYTRGKLSMGMSDDYEIALQEGATHIRVGQKIFGQRPRPTS